jgi:citrate lyase subunit beta / citryl-CoA lyase
MTMTSHAAPRLARSMLFVPATSERKVEKAFASAADAVIVDLEDAVAVSEKAAARALVPGIVATPRALPAWIRTNATTTPFCLRDLEVCALPGVAGIVLPKVESAEQVRAVDWLLSQLEAERGLPDRGIPLLGIVETSRGLCAVDAIASASPRLVRLMFGAIDLAADMGIDLADASGATDPARFAIARASYAASIQPPLDSVYADFADMAALKASAQRAKGFGFRGKACIHPAQLDAIHDTFTPSEQEVQWAERVVAAFTEAERQGLAAIPLDGQMIDYPVVEKARRLLAQVAG